MSGYTDDAADSLTAAAAFLGPENLMAAADYLEQAHPFLMQAGDRYQNRFGQAIARITESWRAELSALSQARDDILSEAVRLRNVR